MTTKLSHYYINYKITGMVEKKGNLIHNIGRKMAQSTTTINMSVCVLETGERGGERREERKHRVRERERERERERSY